MAKNKLIDLNNHLFEQLERLNDDELSEEKLEEEIKRSKSITNVAQTIINNANLMLEAQKHIDDFGSSKTMPNILMLENDNLGQK